jgi:hypothetical protein
VKFPIFLAAAVATVTLEASALTGSFNAKVEAISISDTGVLQQVTFLTSGFNSAIGTCPRPPSNNRYWLRIPDNAAGDKMRDVLLAGNLSQRLMTITWDDTSKDATGLCFLKKIAINSTN